MHRHSWLSALPAGFLALGLLGAPVAALAQAESREGIYLQNQLLELRQELEQLRASGGGRAAPQPSPRGGPPVAGGGELVGPLLDRVNQLEEQVRRLRGQVDENDNRTRQIQQALEKLQGDTDYRFTQLEGGAAAPPAGRPATPPVAAPAGRALTPPAGAIPTPPAPVAAGARPAERAIAEGQAALARHEYEAAEAAAREVLNNRPTARSVDAQMLLADSFAGRRNWGAAAVAYDDAFQRARTGGRAAEAMVGLANSFVGLGNRRDACNTLDDLRSNFPNLRGVHAERAAQLRTRSGCR